MENKEISTEVAKFELMQREAKMFLASGFFGVKDLPQACAKMAIATALGLEPVQGLMGVFIVNGRPSLEASLMAARAKKSGYEFRALRHDAKGAKLEIFSPRGDKLGESEFNEEDAKRADLLGKDTWKKWPKNMYWARAISNACRWYCSDCFGGVTPHIPEELGADVDESGKPVSVEANFKHVVSSSADELNAQLSKPANDMPDTKSDMLFEMEG
jgi:hypothetical protein